jgi:hypothetical protein
MHTDTSEVSTTAATVQVCWAAHAVPVATTLRRAEAFVAAPVPMAFPTAVTVDEGEGAIMPHAFLICMGKFLNP